MGLGYLFALIKTIAPSHKHEQNLTFVPILPEDDVPRAGVRKAELVYNVGGQERKSRVFIVASGQDISVLSAVCSHLGCLVNYNRSKKEFICPCHGGRYDITGKNISGPPPSPLSRFPVRIQHGMVMVGVKA